MIYLVTERFVDDYSVVGVFDDLEKAEQYLEECKVGKEPKYYQYAVDPWDINETRIYKSRGVQ